MLEATKWRLQPLLAAINLKPPALPGDTYFEHARALHTIAALKGETRKLLNDDWQLLLCIAESGEWILQEKVGEVGVSPQRAVALIYADAVHLTQLNKIHNIQVRQLHWHLHNRHMTIGLARNSEGLFEPKMAIYFERRYRSARISPVSLTDLSDLNRVMDDFVVYWLKAERYRDNQSEVIEFTPPELVAARDRILGEFARNIREI